MPDLAINPVGSAISSDAVCIGAVGVVVVVDKVLKTVGFGCKKGRAGRVGGCGVQVTIR